MTSFQKVIKYLAIAFAVFLIFTIISGITAAIGGIGSIFSKKENTKIVEKKELNSLSSYLDIELKRATLNIKKSDKLYVEVSSDDINISDENNKIIIEDKSKKGILNYTKETVNLYIPEDFKYELINIETGAGDLNIEYLNAYKLLLDLGAGKTNIESIYVDESKIKTGAGSFTINSGELTNTNLDVGVGKLEVNAKFYGKNKIDAGVGSIKLNLVDNDYGLHIDKGIGSVTVNGDKVKDNTYIGNGENIIDISGGIGSININILK